MSEPLLSDLKPVRHYRDEPPADVLVQLENSTLNMLNGEDRAIARKALRWPIKDETRAKVVAALERALDRADEEKNTKHVNGTSRMLLEADKMNQADEHLELKTEQGDSPQVVVVLNIPPPKVIGEGE